jgi:hypothetical protein
MTKIKNNPIMAGASGMLGNVVVYRKQRGQLIMANRPTTRDVLTPNQELAKSKFLRAVQYAKKQIADPITKAGYQPGANSRYVSAYAAAVADYLKAPQVNAIITPGYAGATGNTIEVRATDNFKIVSVHVALFKADGTLLEQGDALLTEGTVDAFIYTATLANAPVVGTKVLVTVRDKPGNMVTQDVQL